MYDNPDVLIHVGEGDNAKDFYAHKNILTKRSLYFNAALSNTWARVEGDKMVLRKPNVSPRVFEMLLSYFYAGTIPFDVYNISDILALLIIADELLIPDLLHSLQSYLITNSSSWIDSNIGKVLHTVLKHENVQLLHEYCIKKVAWHPHLIFDKDEYLEYEEYVMLSILESNELQMEEKDIWHHVIKWGIGNTGGLDPDQSKWTVEDYHLLGNTIKNCINNIRFSDFTIGTFYSHVWPYKHCLSSSMRRIIIEYQNNVLPFPILPNILTARCSIVTIESNIITPEQAARIPDWIEQTELMGQTSPSPVRTRKRHEFHLLLRGSRDGFTPDVFHERCDGQGPAVVILRIKGSKQVIGGYNPIGWRGLLKSRWVYTKDSFLFSLGHRNKASDAKLSRISPGNEAIYDDPEFGPCFGKTDLDMRIKFDEENCSAVCRSYNENIVDTSEKFAIDEYEVFRIVSTTVCYGNMWKCSIM
ncbi:4004_t:CDS:2 [Paraglomus brasilianum]|uniref:4004_t:CDS:1 n=1 Tax=Paraglomus brasilianum TaxID=144538 RepID=A0A9N9FJ81_9GLOM|nr:4004_t:CDS:2 [Paraglomus brasilianum]